MKHLAFVCALLVAPALAWADAPSHVINDSNVNTTLDCGEGGKVVLNGSNNNITTAGGCTKVLVNGSGNNVAVGAADKIVVTGSGNNVVYAKGWKKAKPKVSSLGTGNKIAKQR